MLYTENNEFCGYILRLVDINKLTYYRPIFYVYDERGEKLLDVKLITWVVHVTTEHKYIDVILYVPLTMRCDDSRTVFLVPTSMAGETCLLLPRADDTRCRLVAMTSL